jgi:hypothetical protein
MWFEGGDNVKFGGLLPSKITEYTERCNFLRKQVQSPTTNSITVVSTQPSVIPSQNVTNSSILSPSSENAKLPPTSTQNFFVQSTINTPSPFDLQTNSQILSSHLLTSSQVYSIFYCQLLFFSLFHQNHMMNGYVNEIYENV